LVSDAVSEKTILLRLMGPTVPKPIVFTTYLLLICWSLFRHDSYAQTTTFGDLIPDFFLPSSVRYDTPLDCELYFRLADSINLRVYNLTGINPIPDYRCGNDTMSFHTATIAESVRELPPGSILARMVIDRLGRPICCKIYSPDGQQAGKVIAEALSRLILTPGYRNGEAIPTECRFVYDFQAPQLHGRKIIE